MSYGKLITYEKQEAIGVVTLVNEKKVNVINEVFFDEMEEIQREIEKDAGIRVVLILSEGRAFSAGIDLDGLKEAGAAKIKLSAQRFQRIFNMWQELPMPVIAAIQGRCIGAGAELALACDIRIMAEDAKMSLPEARFGLAPDVGGTTRLTKLVGPGRAKMMLFTGQPIKGGQALAMGLAEMAVPAEALRDTAYMIAGELAGLPPSSLRFVKKGVNLAAESSVYAGMLFEQAQSTYCCGTEDIKEAIAAFQEKRDPVFKDK